MKFCTRHRNSGKKCIYCVIEREQDLNRREQEAMRFKKFTKLDLKAVNPEIRSASIKNQRKAMKK